MLLGNVDFLAFSISDGIENSLVLVFSGARLYDLSFRLDINTLCGDCVTGTHCRSC